MKIAVWNEKGGVGKTTTVVTLARLWRDEKPLLLDLERQNPTSNFAAVLRGVTLQHTTPQEVAQVLKAATQSLVLVDCPPNFESAQPILDEVDALIVPCAVEGMAVEAATNILAPLIEIYPKLQIRLLLSMYVPESDAALYRDGLREKYGEKVFKTIIPRNGAVRHAGSRFKTVFDTEEGKTAERRYIALHREIRQWLKMN